MGREIRKEHKEKNMSEKRFEKKRIQDEQGEIRRKGGKDGMKKRRE